MKYADDMKQIASVFIILCLPTTMLFITSKYANDDNKYQFDIIFISSIIDFFIWSLIFLILPYLLVWIEHVVYCIIFAVTTVGLYRIFVDIGLAIKIPYIPTYICRFCHEESPKYQLIKPCKCSGSIMYIHGSCLSKWMDKGNPTCSICNEAYDMTQLYRRSFDMHICAMILLYIGATMMRCHMIYDQFPHVYYGYHLCIFMIYGIHKYRSKKLFLVGDIVYMTYLCTNIYIECISN